MNKAEKQSLKDIVSFVEWSVEHDEPYSKVLTTLSHDIYGLQMTLHGKNDGFLPRTSGWSKK